MTKLDTDLPHCGLDIRSKDLREEAHLRGRAPPARDDGLEGAGSVPIRLSANHCAWWEDMENSGYYMVICRCLQCIACFEDPTQVVQTCANCLPRRVGVVGECWSVDVARRICLLSSKLHGSA